MEVSRGEWIRSLNLAKSVGSNEAVIRQGGKMIAVSETGSVMFFGDTVKFDQDLGLIDVTLLLNMVSKAVSMKVSALISRKVLKIMDTGCEFGYRLADVDVIDVPSEENAEGMDKLVEKSVKVKIEVVRRIADFIRTIMTSRVVFKSIAGDLRVLVGKEETFYGKLTIKEGEGMPEDAQMPFLAQELLAVLNVLDYDEITLGLSFGNNESKVKFLKVSQGDSVWYVGANEEKHEEKKVAKK